MPTGSKGVKRPADVIGNAVKVMRIATGEEATVWIGRRLWKRWTPTRPPRSAAPTKRRKRHETSRPA
jgi:hypothetical protein